MAVLLVEDDPLIRLTLCEFFDDAGVQVLEASNAAEALAIFDLAGSNITVLLTDLDLGPGDDGLVLARAVRRQRPDLPIIYATGSPDILVGHSASLQEQVFLKPFAPSRLVAAVCLLEQQRCDLGLAGLGCAEPAARSKADKMQTRSHRAGQLRG